MLKKAISIYLGLVLIMTQTCVYSESLVEQEDLGFASAFTCLSYEDSYIYGDNKVTGDAGILSSKATKLLISGEFLGVSYDYDSPEVNAAEDAILKFIGKYTKEKEDTNITGNIGSMTFAPGVYRSENLVSITESMTLDADGDKNAKFIFFVKSFNMIDNTRIILSRGANPNNIFWITNETSTIGKETEFYGNVISKNSIKVGVGSKITGRLFAMGGHLEFSNLKLTKPESVNINIPEKFELRKIKILIGTNKVFDGSIEKQISAKSVINNGNTLVPVTFVKDILGGETSYTKNSKGRVETVIINYAGKKIEMKIGQREIKVKDYALEYSVVSEVPPIIIDSRTMIPFKALGQILGADVSYGMKVDNKGVEWVQYTMPE